MKIYAENFTKSLNISKAYFKGVNTEHTASVERNNGTDTFLRDVSTYEYFQNKKDKFTVHDYMALSEDTKEKIRESAEDDEEIAADLNLDIGLDMKRMLDKRYGEDSYIFVSIGTSPSLIAKVLEYTGVEVKYLPISGLAITSKPEEAEGFKKNDFSNYAKFLKEQGLTLKDAIGSPKKLLFYDYARSGTSLKRFEEIMKKYTHVPKFKMEFRTLNEDLFTACPDEERVIDYIRTFLDGSAAQWYTSLNNLNYKEISKTNFTPKRLTKHDNGKTKMFNFLVADKLNRYRRLSENPQNKRAL